MTKPFTIDVTYLKDTLFSLLNIPSPAGYTDQIIHAVGAQLEALDVDFELTRKGAIRGTIPGEIHTPDRAVVSHVDTLGAMVKSVKENTRLGLTPIGHWSARFAEGARVTIFTDTTTKRGTILPLKASGHTYNEEVDTQPVSWDNLEIRIDEICDTRQQVMDLGINVGDFVAIDPQPEMTASGYIVSRHLDNKAGVALHLAAIKAIRDHDISLPVDCHPLFSIFEEVGYGAAAILPEDVAGMVAIRSKPAARRSTWSWRGCARESPPKKCSRCWSWTAPLLTG